MLFIENYNRINSGVVRNVRSNKKIGNRYYSTLNSNIVNEKIKFS